MISIYNVLVRRNLINSKIFLEDFNVKNRKYEITITTIINKCQVSDNYLIIFK